jgi:radical SAM superfamily enzyme YgiQ (UPF0313 family)
MLREAGHRVEVLNLSRLGGKPEPIKALLTEYRPDAVGCSVVNANRWGGIEVARLAKQVNPKVTTLLGGPAATFLDEFFINNFDEIDYVVRGEGEYSTRDLIAALEMGRPEAAADIPGLTFRQGSRVVTTPDAPFIANLDDLPDPAQYFDFQHLAISRGCPADCAFCGSPRLWGRRVRFHSAEYFVDQIERLVRRGAPFLYVSDDTFTLKKKLVIEVCQKIIDRGLDVAWQAISRVDLVDAEIIGWMRRAGCIQISYGVEHGSPQIRKILNKKVSNDQIEKAFSLTRAQGILPRAYFIYGCPGEDQASIDQTIDLIERIKPLGAVFYILTLFPGIRLYDQLAPRLGLDDQVWLERIEDLLYCELDPRLSQDQVLDHGRQLREAFYKKLPEFARDMDLVPGEEWGPLHAAFLSRLGTTFSHGDYAQVEAIPDKAATAEALFERALEYYPDPNAFLGLGLLRHGAGDFVGAAKILEQGITKHPDNQSLAISLGVSLMNLGRLEQAVELFKKFPDNAQAQELLAECYERRGSGQRQWPH